MPDTKAGREKKGRNKKAQLHARLYERELELLGEESDELPSFEGVEGDFLAEELPDDD